VWLFLAHHLDQSLSHDDFFSTTLQNNRKSRLRQPPRVLCSIDLCTPRTRRSRPIFLLPLQRGKGNSTWLELFLSPWFLAVWTRRCPIPSPREELVFPSLSGGTASSYARRLVFSFGGSSHHTERRVPCGGLGWEVVLIHWVSEVFEMFLCPLFVFISSRFAVSLQDLGG
jgi:hypothetical protein